MRIYLTYTLHVIGSSASRAQAKAFRRHISMQMGVSEGVEAGVTWTTSLSRDGSFAAFSGAVSGGAGATPDTEPSH